MPFNITEFKGTVNKYGGPARKNLFVVEITPIQSNDGMSTSDLRFFCQQATVPGINFGVADYYPNGFGVKQSIPISVQNDPFNAVFMLDSDHMVLRFFHQWMQSVINYDYSGGPFSQIDNQLPFEVGYKDDFSATITIKHFTTDDPSSYYEYTLYDAFPTQISGVDVAWADNDSYATATVNFSYSSFSVAGAKQGTPTERFARGTGYLGLATNAANIFYPGQFITQVDLPRGVQDVVNAFVGASRTLNTFKSGFSQIKSGLNSIGNIFG